MKKQVVIMAIDPGYDRVGWAIGTLLGKQLTNIAYGLIQTQADQTLIQRYRAINDQLTKIIETHQPTEAAIESLFFFKNVTTAMHVSEARGVIISCLFRHEVKFAEYTPLQIKQAITGYGRANKKAVEKMVRLQLRASLIINSKKIWDDTLDALALLLTHANSRTLKAT